MFLCCPANDLKSTIFQWLIHIKRQGITSASFFGSSGKGFLVTLKGPTLLVALGNVIMIPSCNHLCLRKKSHTIVYKNYNKTTSGFDSSLICCIFSRF